MRRLALPWIALAVPLAPAFAQQVAPCEPSAICALHMARDAAFVHFAQAEDREDRVASLDTIEYAGKQDLSDSGAPLRARFARMQTQITKLPASERPIWLVHLAQTLAAYDLEADARKISVALPIPLMQQAVSAEIACNHARRGRVREAFSALAEVKDERGRVDTYECIINAITEAGNPERVREIAKYQPTPPPSPTDLTAVLALTELAGGDHAAARATALAIHDLEARVDLLDRIMRRESSDERAATARLLRDQAAGMQDSESKKELLADAVDNHSERPAAEEIEPLIRKLPDSERAAALERLLNNSSDPAVIREAIRVMDAAVPTRPDSLEDDAFFARLRIGDIEPAELVGQVHDSETLATILLNSIGTREPADAEKYLLAAMDANLLTKDPGRQEVVWMWIAQRQAKLQSVAAARQTIDSHMRTDLWRGKALVGLSGFELDQGMPEEAARTRAEGVRRLKLAGWRVDHFAIAEILCDWRSLDAAEAEFRAGIAENPAEVVYRFLAENMLAELGETKRAFDLAALISKALHDSPEPFTLVYLHLSRADAPCFLSPLLKATTCRID